MLQAWKVHLVRTQQSEEPEGRIVFVPPKDTRGWIKLVLRVDQKNEFNGTINCDTGRGFLAEHTIDLKFKDGVAERIVYVEHPIQKCQLGISLALKWNNVEMGVTPLPRMAVMRASLRRNVALAFGFHAGRRPSIWIGIKLLATGNFRQFFRQLCVNANPESIEEKQYETWMRVHERVEERISEWARRNRSNEGVIFSILIPPLETNEKDIRQTVESILGQTYEKWEVMAGLDIGKPSDSRIRHCDHAANNAPDFLQAALTEAIGEYFVILYPGDQLAPHALDAIEEVVQAKPDADFLYCDEDILDATDTRRDPFFKPDWSPEFLLGSMYVGQLAVYRTALVRQLGGFKAECGEAYDYDLALRVTSNAKSIVHISEILYHRRVEYVRSQRADMQAIQSNLQALGQSVEVAPSCYGGSHQVRFPIVGQPLVSIIMASACKPIALPATRFHPAQKGFWALNSIRWLRERMTYGRVEIVLLSPLEIDDQLGCDLDALGVIRQTYHQPFNFSAATNQAAALSHGEHLLLLNDDTEIISPDFIEQMLSFSQQPAIGVIGAKLLFADETIQHAGIILPDCSPGHPFHHQPQDSGGYHGSAQTHRNYLAVTAACMMTRRDVFEQLGGFDELFHMNYNDVDYCLRAVQKGYRVVYQPAAELYHHESMSKPPIQRNELRAFQKRWASIYPEDPFYHREFRPEFCDFVLRG